MPRLEEKKSGKPAKIQKEKRETMKLNKLLAVLLAVFMLVPVLAACDNGNNPGTGSGTTSGSTQNPVVATDPYAGKSHLEISEAVYEQVLGDFNKYYQQAKEATSVSERQALMAIAEAKLLSSGAFLPMTSQGGNYAISRVVPYSANTTLWGNDADRFYSSLIVKGEPLTPAVRDEMKAKWGELRGTGTYLTWAKQYLASKNYELNREYNMLYDSDPETWDALGTSMAVDSEAIVNTYDGLLMYNEENVQVPAIAKEAPTVSADGKTYTFKLREDVVWVDYQGKEVEKVTAKSFVLGFQHMLDAAGGLEWLVDGVILNAGKYQTGEITDFTQVGVKAVDEYTLEYTLEAPTSYFPTMFAYNIFAPICEKIFLQNGGAFGVAEFAAAAEKDSYTYGTSPEKIGYCGPYLVTNFTASNTIIFSANPTYYNKDAVNLDKITWIYTKGDNKLEGYNKTMAEEIAGAGLNTDSMAKAKTDGNFEKYAYVSSTDATSYPAFLNLYRQAYANFNDNTVAVSKLTEDEKVRTHLATLNKNFRLAFVSSIDRAAYNAVTTGDELKLNSLVNSYTPGNFVALTEDVTVKINGTDTTFKAGTFYGAIMQAQIDADGVGVKVWDPQADGGAGASFGFDGWYNVDACRKYLAAAVTELAAQGVEVSKEKPIILELPYADAVPVFTDRANVIKQSIEAASEGLIKVELIATGGSDRTNYNNATYNPQAGNQMNYNINTNSGWGPDYGDPQTYLDTMLPDGAGYMTKCLGLF